MLRGKSKSSVASLGLLLLMLAIVPALGGIPTARAFIGASLVQQNNAGAVSGSSPALVTVTLSSPVTAGDVLVVGVETPGAYSLPTVTDSFGSTFSRIVTASGNFASIYTATLASGGSDSITASFAPLFVAPSDFNVFVYEVAGVTAASATTGSGTGTGTSISTSSVSYPAGAFLLGMVTQDFGGAVTAGAGFTLSPEHSGIGVSNGQYLISASASSSIFPAMVASSVQWWEAAIALSPAAPTLPVTTPPPCPSTTGGTYMPLSATFTDAYGNTWVAPSGNLGGGTWSSYFFSGAQSSVPAPMMQGWGGDYGTYSGQQGWIVTFYCS